MLSLPENVQSFCLSCIAAELMENAHGYSDLGLISLKSHTSQNRNTADIRFCLSFLLANTYLSTFGPVGEMLPSIHKHHQLEQVFRTDCFPATVILQRELGFLERCLVPIISHLA